MRCGKYFAGKESMFLQCIRLFKKIHIWFRTRRRAPLVSHVSEKDLIICAFKTTESTPTWATLEPLSEDTSSCVTVQFSSERLH